MLRLETVEDFEKVKKAFDNPRSKHYQFMVRNFGYCKICRIVTEYEGNYSFESCHETCRKCGSIFGYPKTHGTLPSDFYITINMDDMFPMPSSPVPNYEVYLKLEQLHSRKQQKIFFQELLEKFIKKIKAAERQARNKTRQLAKLRI